MPGTANVTAEFLSRHLRDRTDWKLDPYLFLEAAATDAFIQIVGRQSTSWSSTDCGASYRGYCRKFKATHVLTTPPLWKAQPWFPVILDLLVALLLPVPVGHGDNPAFRLPRTVTVQRECTISCSWSHGRSQETVISTRDSLTRLPNSSWDHGETRPMPIIIQLGGNGKDGARREVSVAFLTTLQSILEFLASEFESGKK